jgi:AraC family transcriptional regulator, arabinose operon regulatory protein
MGGIAAKDIESRLGQPKRPWTFWLEPLQNPLIVRAAMARTFAEKRNRFVLQHVPDDAARSAYWCVVRAGHGGPIAGDSFARDTYPGHELFLCLRGNARVRTRGQSWEVKTGDAIWVNCYHPHRYTSATVDPWEYYWVRCEGAQLDAVWKLILAAGGPVAPGCDTKEKLSVFERIFALLREKPANLDALIHAELARWVALFLHALQIAGRSATASLDVPDRLRPALERMRLYHHLPLRLAELAELAELSPSQFTRAFRSAIGTSPIDWLRQTRIEQAKRRLRESADTLKEIATQVGYGDQFYFSRDFKRMTGVSPSEFRAGGGL